MSNALIAGANFSNFCPFSKGFFLKYSEQEITDTISNIQHPIIRETLNLITPNIKKIELIILTIVKYSKFIK